MNKLLFLLFISLASLNLWADSLPAYEQDFLRNEEEMINKNQLISKQAAKDIVLNGIYNHYPKMKKSELKELVSNAEVILVEGITPEGASIFDIVRFYYVITAKQENGRVLFTESVNAITGELLYGMMNDDKDITDFVTLPDRNEIIDYIKKYFSYPEESKLIIRTIFDFSFYSSEGLPYQDTNWKYRITIQNGLFISSDNPLGVGTLFISPYVQSYTGKKAPPAPANNIGLAKHRIYTYNKSQAATPDTKATAAKRPQDTYIGVD